VKGADEIVGAIIPITAGRMRNEFYPRKMAEYVTAAQLHELGLQDSALERDPTFGISQQQVASREPKKPEAPITVAVDLLKVRRSLAILAVNELLTFDVAGSCN
jgi:hypothetical protein